MGHGTADFKREFLSAHSSPLSVGHGEGPGGAAQFKVKSQQEASGETATKHRGASGEPAANADHDCGETEHAPSEVDLFACV